MPSILPPHRHVLQSLLLALEAYEPATSWDGHGILIDCLWPRGASPYASEQGSQVGSRTTAEHEPPGVVRARSGPLEESAAATSRSSRGRRPHLTELRRRIRSGTLTPVYAARDTEHNDAIVRAEVCAVDCRGPEAG